MSPYCPSPMNPPHSTFLPHLYLHPTNLTASFLSSRCSQQQSAPTCKPLEGDSLRSSYRCLGQCQLGFLALVRVSLDWG